jgi:ATP-dependent helicase/nuclease subunit A
VPIAGAPPDATALVWAAAQAKDAGPMGDARTKALDAARDEYRRLLYVGLTRAADRLLVCGAKGVNRVPKGCWHDLVLTALQPLSEEVGNDEGKVWHFRKGVPASGDKPREVKSRAELPPWLTSTASSSPTLKMLRPSDTTDDEPRHFTSGGEREAARLRGLLVHRLLQSLPDVAADRRHKVAEGYLARAGRELQSVDRVRLAEQVMRVIDDARFRELFVSGSRAEVPIVGTLFSGSETVTVSGQVDRLSVTQAAVLIGDFKTNREPPRRIEDVPPAYVRQLALYRALLRKLYPDRPVRAALVWTEVPDLMELSEALLDRALEEATARVTST